MSAHQHRSFDVFRDEMLRALMNPTIAVPGDGTAPNPLAQMDEGNSSGPIQALVTAWSMVGDVLTFYQERIAEERDLSTAREDFSAYAMTRMLGYAPQPVLSARVWLSFAAGADRSRSFLIPRGTSVANVPEQGKLPAAFETTVDLVAYADWNNVPLSTETKPSVAKLAPNATRLTLEGTDPIVPGSVMVMRVRNSGGPRFIATVIADTVVDRLRNVTLVRWQPLSPGAIIGGEEVVDVRLLVMNVRPFGALAPPYATASPLERRRYARGGVALQKDDAWHSASSGLSESPVGLAFGRGALFGINAGQLFRRTAAEPWNRSTPFAAYPAQMIVATPGGLLAVGTATGHVLVSIDDGLTWSLVGGAVPPPKKLGRFQMPSLPSMPIRGVAIDESTEVPTVFVATDRGVASISLNGAVWTWRNVGFPGTDPKTGVAALGAMSILVADAEGTLLATTTYGVFRSARGESWSRIWGLGSVSSVTALSNGALVAIGPGGVFRSDDGFVWEKALVCDGAPRALASGTTTVVVAVGSEAYVSSDGGKTWMPLGEPLRMPIHAVAVARDASVAVASPFVDDPGPDWPGLVLEGDLLRFDREVQVVPGDVIAISLDLDGAVVCEAYVVRSVATAMISEFGLTGLSTQVRIDRPIATSLRDARHVVIHVGMRPRSAIAVKRESPAPPTLVLDVPRGLSELPTARDLMIEGQPVRVQLAALAGGPLVVSPRGGEALPDTLRMLRCTDTSVPTLDVDAVARIGDAGLIIARFDGIWHCANVASAAWWHLPDPPFPACSVACFGETVYATCVDVSATESKSGVYVLNGDDWVSELAGAMRRVVVAGGELWACADTGLYMLTRGAWSLVDPLFECRGVSSLAASDGVILVATDDGVYARDGGGVWRRLSGLNGIAVNVVEIGTNAWYAGTRTAGTWKRAPQASEWSAIASRSYADVQALWIDGDDLMIAERGFGITSGGEMIDVTLATNVVAIVPIVVEGEQYVVAFRGIPLLPPAHAGETYIAMRRHKASFSDGIEGHTLDAGVLAPATRARLEAALGVKLQNFELVVEATGRAWRLDGRDPLPVYLLRSEPDAFAIFAVERIELETPPAPAWNASESLRWMLRGAWVSAPALVAGNDDVWYASARPDADVRAESAVLATQSDTQLVLRRPLVHALDPDTIGVCANIVEATHGARILRDEVILSGDASVRAQSATLASRPLSNVVEDESAAAAQLHVWVRADVPDDPIAATAALANREHDGEMIHWQCVRDFSKSGPSAPHFMLQQDSQGRATLTFGDGENGRRVPTGRDNVVARYRVGGGADGNVVARTLTLFQKPHAGLSAVYNALPARGGVNAESVADVRDRAALGLVSLDRVVSEHDLLDYVAAWSGVTKVSRARVRRARSSARSQLLITVAPTEVDIDELERAVRRDGAKSWDLRFVAYRERRFVLRASLILDPAFESASVLRVAKARIVEEYSFERRDLRQDVYESSLIASLQKLPGVRAVTIDALYESSGMRSVNGRLIGDDERSSEPASLLVIDPDALVLQGVSA